MSKKKKIVIISIALVLIIVGISYALWNPLISQEGNNRVKTGCFEVSYDDEDDISLAKSFPMTDSDGSKLTPYTFTITNKCTISSDYTVFLNISTRSSIPSSTVKLQIGDEAPRMLNTYTENSSFDTNLYQQSYAIASGELVNANKQNGEGGTASFSIRLWLDENTSDQYMRQDFIAKVSVDTVATILEKETTRLGTEIALGNEKFYIIADNGDTITALAKYNLLVGLDYSSSRTYCQNQPCLIPDTAEGFGIQNENAKGYLCDNYGCHYTPGTLGFKSSDTWGSYPTIFDSQELPYVYDSNTNWDGYYYYEEHYDDGGYGSGYRSETFNIYNYVENYASNLRNLYPSVTARLMSYEEAVNMENDGLSSILYSSSYWLGSSGSGDKYDGYFVSNSNQIWVIYNSKKESRHCNSSANEFGIRPVIIIAKSDLN